MAETAKDFLVLNGLTHHWPRDETLNEENVGIGWERRMPESSIGAGIMKDSFRNPSPYVQASWLPDEAQFGPVSLGLTGSLSHRESAEGNPMDGLSFIPMATGELMITDDTGVNLGIVPPVTDKGGLAFLQFKHSFGGGDGEKRTPAGDELERRVSDRDVKLSDMQDEEG